jgi:phosphoglycerol transferase MdoB-like AlkP superfamily enzyme
VEARDEDTNVVLMAQQRDTLVTTFARHGYRTIAVMPGLRQRWPEGAFYGFDHIYDTAQLDYRGPRFGWWTVPDQFALARLDVLEAARDRADDGSGGGSAPRFVFFPTTSTHAPFGPTAPYQPDWSRVVSDEPYGKPDVERALALEPDYLNLGPSYARAVSYAYASIGGYLRQHSGRDIVMVVIGDHQPAAAVSGEGASWDVPVHVITSRAAVLDRLRERGFRPGVHPPRTALGKMHALLPTLLDAFGGGR